MTLAAKGRRPSMWRKWLRWKNRERGQRDSPSPGREQAPSSSAAGEPPRLETQSVAEDHKELPSDPPPARPPEGERMRILRLIQEGKVSPEEGVKLLEALGVESLSGQG